MVLYGVKHISTLDIYGGVDYGGVDYNLGYTPNAVGFEYFKDWLIDYKDILIGWWLPCCFLITFTMAILSFWVDTNGLFGAMFAIWFMLAVYGTFSYSFCLIY